MKKRIFKYPLDIVGLQPIFIPDGGEILSAQLQYGTLCLWVLVNPDNTPQRRNIAIIGTGNPIPDGEYVFIDTSQMSGGALVWHIFEKL